VHRRIIHARGLPYERRRHRRGVQPRKRNGVLQDTQLAETSEYDLQTIQSFEDFPLFFAGESLDGIPLTSIDSLGSPGNGPFVSFVYGDCHTVGEGGCPYPLEIQVWPSCERNLAKFRANDNPLANESEELTIRGAPALAIAGGVILNVYVGDVTVAIFGSPDRTKLAAQALRSVDGAIWADETLPAASSAALEGTLPCPAFSRPSTNPEAVSSVNDASLQNGLLALADVAPGWLDLADEQYFRGLDFCVPLSVQPVSVAFANFRSPDETAWLGDIVQSYSSVDEARKVFEEIADAVLSCHEEPSELALEPLGEESRAFDISRDGISQYQRLVRDDNSIILVTVLGLSIQDLDSYASAALEKAQILIE
jgi:hypothetical protein